VGNSNGRDAVEDEDYRNQIQQRQSQKGRRPNSNELNDHNGGSHSDGSGYNKKQTPSRYGEFESPEAIAAAARSLGLDLYDTEYEKTSAEVSYENGSRGRTQGGEGGEGGGRRSSKKEGAISQSIYSSGMTKQMFNCAIISISMEVDILALSVLELLLL